MTSLFFLAERISGKLKYKAVNAEFCKDLSFLLYDVSRCFTFLHIIKFYYAGLKHFKVILRFKQIDFFDKK